MTPAERSIPDCHGAVCVTCADEAVAMRVLRVDGGGLAECAEGDGATHMVETALAGAVAVGDSLLVHAGVALARLDEGGTR